MSKKTFVDVVEITCSDPLDKHVRNSQYYRGWKNPGPWNQAV